jgi:hypothetical protein
MVLDNNGYAVLKAKREIRYGTCKSLVSIVKGTLARSIILDSAEARVTCVVPTLISWTSPTLPSSAVPSPS